MAETHTKLTVMLTPKATAAMERVAELEGKSKTDAVNRALQLYAELVADRAQGAEIYILKPDPDGDVQPALNIGSVSLSAGGTYRIERMTWT